MNNKKKTIKVIFCIAVVLLMFFILYRMFRDSYEDIVDSLSKTNMYIFAGMVLLGNCYYLIDAVVYYGITVRQGIKIKFSKFIPIAYMSIFFNVTSFGAGIKPAQILYLHKNGVDTGTACSITMMPYIFHKTVIVVYAVIMLILNNNFVVTNFSSSFRYMYMGVGLSIAIIVFMILLCSAEWFHRLVCKILDATLGKTRFKEVNEKIKTQIVLLREATVKIIKKPAAWISLTLIDALKMSCWYVIPTLAIYALGGDLGGVSFAQGLTVTSLMQLLMGVLPTSGGVGSLEVVFSVLFAAVFGKVVAGSSMVLYRLSTYYIPFLFSLVMMAIIGKDLRKMQKAEEEKKKTELDYDNIRI